MDAGGNRAVGEGAGHTESQEEGARADSVSDVNKCEQKPAPAQKQPTVKKVRSGSAIHRTYGAWQPEKSVDVSGAGAEGNIVPANKGGNTTVPQESNPSINRKPSNKPAAAPAEETAGLDRTANKLVEVRGCFGLMS